MDLSKENTTGHNGYYLQIWSCPADVPFNGQLLKIAKICEARVLLQFGHS
jgi:hypothetical protein